MYNLTIALALLTSLSCIAGVKYSEGYRAGVINKFSVKGFSFKTGEGEMLMGKDSTEYSTTTTDREGNETKTTYNPWKFSTEKTVASTYENFIGKNVVIHYKSEIDSFYMRSSSEYQALDIEEINPHNGLTQSCIDESANGSYSNGKRIGRIVKLSTVGLVKDSYEMMMQVGDSGNIFVAMTIKSDDMNECAKTALMAGQKVIVEYRKLGMYNMLTRDSAYSVYKISPAK